VDGPNAQKLDSLGVLVPNFLRLPQACVWIWQCLANKQGAARQRTWGSNGPEDWVRTCGFIIKNGESLGFNMNYPQNISKYGDIMGLI